MAFWFAAQKDGVGRVWVGFIRRDGVEKYLPHFHGRPTVSAGAMRGDGWEDVPDDEAIRLAQYADRRIDFDQSFKLEG
ncbi:hypothetical protein [Polaromonas sp.]|jgi:hypothetical protein|uniref:hypothetical protein n=1 Tax=Polaromonas sp. TaxID=1869339 RepID=UPI002C51738D|nr:hypothetical protein [Polaromonas sp.]HQS33743.1 hypothetical protein [Polaromonas sp.]HQS92961.1 hypothetical protein [Polaromonas sp.]